MFIAGIVLLYIIMIAVFAGILDTNGNQDVVFASLIWPIVLLFFLADLLLVPTFFILKFPYRIGTWIGKKL